MKRILSTLALAVSVSHANAEIAWHTTVKEVITPANGEQVAVFGVTLTLPSPCESNRVKFNKAEKSVLALLLTAQTTGKTVSFYYEPNGKTLSGISGHGVGSCELINVWIES